MEKIIGSKGLIIGIAVIAIVGGGFFLIPEKEKTEKFDLDTYSPSGSTAGGKFSMKDLLTKTAAQRCTFSSGTTAADSTGTVYVAGGRMRGDFESVIKVGTPGKTTKSHMIADSEFTYVWSDEMPTMGMKMPKSMMEARQVGKGNEGDVSPLDMDIEVDFACAPWSADESLLTPPSEVTWNDMGAMMNGSAVPNLGAQGVGGVPNMGMNGGMPGADDLKTMQCNACDQAGPDREACRVALSCP